MKKIRENLATIVAGAAVFVMLALSFVAFGPQNLHGKGVLMAVVHDGEGHEHRLPLDQDATLQINTTLGTNVVEVLDGSVRMAEADCPNQDCLHQMPISQPGQQLICLPHRLWVEIVSDGAEGTGSPDAITVVWDADARDATASQTGADVLGVDLVAR